MNTETMNPKIAELAKELLLITDNPPARPTQDDRMKLMDVRNRIKKLPDEVELDDVASTDCHYLYVMATKEANRQEEFWENNGNKWAV